MGLEGLANRGGYGDGHDSGELWWHNEDIKPGGSGAWKIVDSLLGEDNVSGCDL